MDTTRRDMLSLGALGAGAAFGATLLAPAVARADAGLRIGLVDIGLIFKSYKRKDDLEKEINALRESYEKQAQKQQDELESLRRAMGTIKEGSDLWRQKKKEINLQMSQMKVIRDGWDEELKFKVENLTLMILNEIEDRVKTYGEQNKYDLILKIDSQGWGDERFQERIFRAQVSSILYHKPDLDVTNQVLALLNDPNWIKQQQEKAQGSQQSAPPPAPPTPPGKPK
jgi:Skp family chaperone for outer membrane proteins